MYVLIYILCIYVCICVFIYYFIYLFIYSLAHCQVGQVGLLREKGLDIGRRPLHHISFPCSSGSSLQDSLLCRLLQELDCTYFLLLMFCVRMLGHCKSFLCNHLFV